MQKIKNFFRFLTKGKVGNDDNLTTNKNKDYVENLVADKYEDYDEPFFNDDITVDEDDYEEDERFIVLTFPYDD